MHRELEILHVAYVCVYLQYVNSREAPNASGGEKGRFRRISPLATAGTSRFNGSVHPGYFDSRDIGY